MYDSSTADAAEVTLKHFLVTHISGSSRIATIDNAAFPVPALRDLWLGHRTVPHSPCKILERAPRYRGAPERQPRLLHMWLCRSMTVAKRRLIRTI